MSSLNYLALSQAVADPEGVRGGSGVGVEQIISFLYGIVKKNDSSSANRPPPPKFI